MVRAMPQRPSFGKDLTAPATYQNKCYQNGVKLDGITNTTIAVI